MDAAERVDIIKRGVAALRLIEAERRLSFRHRNTMTRRAFVNSGRWRQSLTAWKMTPRVWGTIPSA